MVPIRVLRGTGRVIFINYRAHAIGSCRSDSYNSRVRVKMALSRQIVKNDLFTLKNRKKINLFRVK